MFGRSNLMREGASADGVVLDSKLHVNWVFNWSAIFPNSSWRYKLEVQFPDGTRTEITRKVREGAYGLPLNVGQIVPMRYDPEHRSRMEIDIPALKAGHRAEVKHGKQAAIAHGEEELARRRRAGQNRPAADAPPSGPDAPS
jgi:hypothetical protein